MKEQNDIDQLFRDNFEDFSVTPPASLKQQIDANIKQPNKYKLWIWLSVFALIFALTGLTYFLFTNETKHAFTPLAANSNSSPTSLDNKASSNNSTLSAATSSAAPSTNDNANAATNTDSPTKTGTATSVSVTHEYVKTRTEHKTEITSSKHEFSTQGPKKGTVTSTKKVKSTILTGNPIASTTSTSFSSSDTKQASKSTSRSKTGRNAKKGASVNSTGDQSSKSSADGNTGEKSIVNTPDAASTPATKATTGSPTGSETAATTKKDSLARPSTEVKKDSLPAITQAEKDSSNNAPKVDQNAGQPKQDKATIANKNWLILLQGGTAFTTKYSYTQNANENIKTSSRPGFGVDLAFSRNINIGKLSYVGLNGGYSTYSNTNAYNFQNQQVYTPNDSLPIYDSVNNIIGYYYPTSDTTIVSNASSDFTTAVTVISFGLQAQFDFNLGKTIGLSLTPGFRYALNNMKNSDATLTNYKPQRLQFQLGLDLYYDWKQWRFIVGMNSRYLMNLKAPAFTYQERNRLQFMPQLGVGFKF